MKHATYEKNNWKEAMFYRTLEGDNKTTVQCELCPKKCVIKSGDYGRCGVRKNINGKLYSLVYAKPVSINIDPIEKKPLYHFHPGVQILSLGTIGCNMTCLFCQNHEISQANDIPNLEDVLEKMEFVPPEKIIQIAKENNLSFIAFTYTEPTIFYEYMVDIAKLAKKEKIKTVVVSNGQINQKPLKLLLPLIDAFNIDLKAFNQEFYSKICNGFLDTTKENIFEISKAGKHIEVTFLMIEGYNDDPVEFEKMCRFLSEIDKKIVLHISRAFPYYKLSFPPTDIDKMKNFKDIAKKYLTYVYLGNV